MPILELVTTGHRSGDPKSILVTYIAVDGDFAIAGSNSGAARDPAWIENLRAHPGARVREDGKWREVRARFLDGRERTDLWEKFKTFPDYARYEQMTERVIPVVVLETP
jgi:deazaflavin-dependent oxidoreductase (nitroreductase family)